MPVPLVAAGFYDEPVTGDFDPREAAAALNAAGFAAKVS